METSSSAVAPVSAGRDALMGFAIGTPFAAHQVLLQQLGSLGYDAAPPALDDTRRVVLIRRNAAGKEAGAIVLGYDRAGLLESASLMVGGRAFTDAAGAKAAATELREEVLSELGAPQLSLDDIDVWAAAGGFDDTDSSAYSAYWVAGQGADAKATSAGAYLTQMRDAQGPVASVSITPGRGTDGMLMMAVVQVRA